MENNKVETTDRDDITMLSIIVFMLFIVDIIEIL